MPDTSTYLNLGCGGRYHPDWINIDMGSQGPGVIQHDLSHGIPLPASACEVVYHSAVLEHIRRPDVAAFLEECYRVLKPGGVIRVGVPDLERICRLYLSALEAALNGDDAARHGYDWMMLELYDQVVRERSGGAMLDYFRQEPLPNPRFLRERMGDEYVDGKLEVLRRRRNDAGRTSRLPGGFPSFGALLRAIPDAIKYRTVLWLLGSGDRQALDIGRFRLGGEVHQWMYDRYSLAGLLTRAGFCDPVVQEAHTSRIPDWTHFNLDTLPDGRERKPDLFFMEAVKPDDSVHS